MAIVNQTNGQKTRNMIFTGGPGVGKTTMVNLLAEEHTLVPEVAREIIEEQQNLDNPIVPWTRFSEFQDLYMARQVGYEAAIQGESRVLDRSLVDSLAYCRVAGEEPPAGIHEAIAQAGYGRVFFLEQLSAYETDDQRMEDKALADKIHQAIYEVYEELGFDIVKVPEMSIEERLEFINENIEDSQREVEAKFSVEDFNGIRDKINSYRLAAHSRVHEENTTYDLGGILKQNGMLARLRKDDGFRFTFKGPNRSETMLDRFEFELGISESAYEALSSMLPPDVKYSKIRETFIPLGDTRSTICLDHVYDVGSFVEIESGSERQVEMWRDRLGITSRPIGESYTSIVRRRSGRA